jgi:metacaspase-1
VFFVFNTRRLVVDGDNVNQFRCEDKQTSADVSNVHSFQLPDPAGRAGGALTSALLHVTYADEEDTGKDLTFKETLMEVRTKLEGKGFEQIPQLSSSRHTNLDEKFSLIPDDFSGKRRAVMIGINYIGDNPGEYYFYIFIPICVFKRYR